MLLEPGKSGAIGERYRSQMAKPVKLLEPDRHVLTDKDHPSHEV